MLSANLRAPEVRLGPPAEAHRIPARIPRGSILATGTVKIMSLNTYVVKSIYVGRCLCKAFLRRRRAGFSLNGDVRHGSGRCNAMPVLLASREPDHIPGPNLLDGSLVIMVSSDQILQRFQSPLSKYVWHPLTDHRRIPPVRWASGL